MKRVVVYLLFMFAVTTLAGCATMGNDFPGGYASTIVVSQTTRAEVENILGTPFRTGLDSGHPTSTYLFYRVGLFNQPVTKDLTVTYAPDNTVKSYSYNSNESNQQIKGDDQKSDYNQR